MHEDDQRVPANKELLEGTGGVDDHRQLLQVNRLQAQGVVRLQHARAAFEGVVANIVEVCASAGESGRTYLSKTLRKTNVLNAREPDRFVLSKDIGKGGILSEKLGCNRYKKIP